MPTLWDSTWGPANSKAKKAGLAQLTVQDTTDCHGREGMLRYTKMNEADQFKLEYQAKDSNKQVISKR